MNFKSHLYIGFLIVILTPLGFGCAIDNRYGRLTVEPNMLTIEQLSENWENYYVYVSYFGATQNRPYGIMFDPKDDDRKLEVHGSWSRVEDQKQLLTLIGMLRTNQSLVYMWVMHGPDKQTYGYMYTFHQDVLIRVVDEKTLRVNELLPSAFDLWLGMTNEDVLLATTGRSVAGTVGCLLPAAC